MVKVALFIFMLSLPTLGAFHCYLDLFERSAIETNVIFEISEDHTPQRELLTGSVVLSRGQGGLSKTIRVGDFEEIILANRLDPTDLETPFKLQVQFRSMVDPRYNVVSPLLHPSTFRGPSKHLLTYTFPDRAADDFLQFAEHFQDLPRHTFVYADAYLETALQFDFRTAPKTADRMPAENISWKPIEKQQFHEATSIPVQPFNTYLKSLKSDAIRYWSGKGNVSGTDAETGMVLYEVNRNRVTYYHAFMIGGIDINEVAQQRRLQENR